MSAPWIEKREFAKATLYLGDSLQIMPMLSKVGCVVTDPPYRLESGGKYTGEMGGKFAQDAYDNSGAIVETEVHWDDFMPLIADRVDQGHIYVMCNNRNVQACLNAASAAGMRFHNLLVWNKGTVTPNRWYMKNLEFTAFLFKGKARPINMLRSKQLIRVPNVLMGQHPTEKPVELMKHYILNSTNKGEVVLDPFMGIGTTGVAALLAGREFIGIEKDEDYYRLACKRMERAYFDQELLFDE